MHFVRWVDIASGGRKKTGRIKLAMTPDAFRKLALSFEGAVESEHMRHPDFRMGGRIFATLHAPTEAWGMVKLTPEQQKSFMAAHTETFKPASGAWGRQGCTLVRLKTVKKGILTAALEAAFQNAAEQGKGSTSGTRAALSGKQPKEARKLSKRPKTPSPQPGQPKTLEMRREKIKRASKRSSLERIRALCLAHPNTKETLTWGKPHFRVGEKIFAGVDDDQGVSVLGCKLQMDHAAGLVKLLGYRPAPYVGKKGWVSIDLSIVTDWNHIGELIEESYELISGCSLRSSKPSRKPRRRR